MRILLVAALASCASTLRVEGVEVTSVSKASEAFDDLPVFVRTFRDEYPDATLRRVTLDEKWETNNGARRMQMIAHLQRRGRCYVASVWFEASPGGAPRLADVVDPNAMRTGPRSNDVFRSRDGKRETPLASVSCSE